MTCLPVTGSCLIMNLRLRGETFVTRKITRAVARIALGMQEDFFLGNLDAQRDWGHAKDYVQAMWLMLQQEQAEDFVIATGKTTSVRDLVIMAFKCVGIELEFSGTGVEEVARVANAKNPDFPVEAGKVVLRVDPKYHRPTEVDLLIGDASKCKEKLNWEPKHSLEDLVEEMVAADVALFRREKYLREGGHRTLDYNGSEKVLVFSDQSSEIIYI